MQDTIYRNLKEARVHNDRFIDVNKIIQKTLQLGQIKGQVKTYKKIGFLATTNGYPNEYYYLVDGKKIIIEY